MTINQHNSILHDFFCPQLTRNVRGRRRIDSSSIIAHPVNFETSLKCDAKNSTYICIYIYIYDLSIIDIDFVYQFNLKLIALLFTFFCLKKKNVFLNFQKLTGLWLAGVVVNHVGIYGSKVAEGLSAFQRRSCYYMFYFCLNASLFFFTLFSCCEWCFIIYWISFYRDVVLTLSINFINYMLQKW